MANDSLDEKAANVGDVVKKLRDLAISYEATAKAERCVVNGLEPYRKAFHDGDTSEQVSSMMRIFCDARSNAERSTSIAETLEMAIRRLEEAYGQ